MEGGGRGGWGEGDEQHNGLLREKRDLSKKLKIQLSLIVMNLALLKYPSELQLVFDQSDFLKK